MSIDRIILAIVSDLHCQASNDIAEGMESFLYLDRPRNVPNQHPIEALKVLFKEIDTEIDILMCCGDLTNKASPGGLAFSRSVMRSDLMEITGARKLYCVNGNHDVQSRDSGVDPFQLVRGQYPELPTGIEETDSKYWLNGFVLVADSELLHLALINTAHHHWNEPQARTGTLSEKCISDIETNLSSSHSQSQPFKIAVLHHHPHTHSGAGDTGCDLISNGDRLMGALARAGFKYVIHGHKHLPRISRYTSTGYEMYVCCMGSFSKILGEEISTDARNAFHIMDLEYDKDSKVNNGKLYTWEYHLSSGWTKPNLTSMGIPHVVELVDGFPNIDNIARALSEKMTNTEKLKYAEDDLETDFPQIFQLLPYEMSCLKEKLKLDYQTIIRFDDAGRIFQIERMYP